jgi:molybdopterin adenylyltransferase
MKVGRITSSDRAAAGVYPDLSGPEIERCLEALFPDQSLEWVRVLIPDERAGIEGALCRLCDDEACALVITTGGTGIGPRDVMPEATRAILDRELPGFGEAMRMGSLPHVPTAILSRATAGTRARALVINLPGNPAAVTECIRLLGPAIRDGLGHLA